MDKTQQEVFSQRTEYSHSTDQGCYMWKPKITGLSAWSSARSDDPAPYGVTDKNDMHTLVGAASTTNMSIMYSCTHHGCIIFCPCSCCTDNRDSCKKICGNFPCTDCSNQCTEHSLTLPRAFDPATDNFTMVTDCIQSARYVIPYTGIPLSCKNCTLDTYEHQVFHHVFHGRCKFCVMEMRPMKHLTDDMSLKAFKKAVAVVRKDDERTCVYCLRKLSGTFERKIHEKTIHEKIENKHNCKKCGKIYTNSTALKYHLGKHEESKELKCEVCNKTFVSQNGLNSHKEIAHTSETEKFKKYICETCDDAFTTSSHLARHQKIKHYKSNANRDYAECFKNVDEFECDQCEKVFKRKDVLKRHKQTVHETSLDLQCSSCEKSFKRRDKLTKHIKLEHDSENSK